MTHANSDTHALNASLDFLSAVATGATWQQALQQVVASLADEPAARGVLPSALLDCRIATIRKLGGLPKELVGAFDSAIAQLVVGDSACDAEQLTSLLKSMANAPRHIPRGTLDAALDRITYRIDRGEDAHGLLGALEDIHDRVVQSEKQPEMRITSSGALHITLPTPGPEVVPVEAPRPNEKWLRDVENLLATMGEERARVMAKGALCSFVLAEEPQSCETLLGYAWLSERLCDEELLQILAEVANRCLQDGPVEDTHGLGMASANALAQQSCSRSIAWLDWLHAEAATPQVKDKLQQLYEHRQPPTAKSWR